MRWSCFGGRGDKLGDGDVEHLRLTADVKQEEEGRGRVQGRERHTSGSTTRSQERKGKQRMESLA